MVDFSSIHTALQGGPVSLIVAAGLFIKFAAPGVAQLIDAWTRRGWMKRSPAPIAASEKPADVEAPKLAKTD